MDKFEYKIRADEIKELIGQERYAEAAEIADTIDWRRVKSVMMLCTISDLYKMNRRYEDARDILLLAYDRRPGGRTICYSLCELSIKMDEIPQAQEYLNEFIQIAPKDSSRYILQYKLLQALDVSMEERIQVLEKLKEQDPRERWQYELAYLYHMVGLESHCVDECDELVLWFGQGKYVIKALELKMLHRPLTEQQQALYDEYKRNLECSKHVAREQEKQPAEFEEMPIQVKTMDVSRYNTINLQEELAADLEKVLQPDYHSQSENPVEDPVTRAIVEPMYEYDTESFDVPDVPEVSTDDVESEDIRYQTVQFGDLGLDALEKADAAHEQAQTAKRLSEEAPETEVFFGETGDIAPVIKEESWEVDFDGAGDTKVIPAPLSENESVQEVIAEEVSDSAEEEEVIAKQEEVPETDAKPREEAVVKPAMVQAEPPKYMADVLSQEYDGQLSLVMPESESIEKQITGQLNIEDILAEWERRKKENEEKRKEEVRQHVLEQTGSMFTEFEASMRDGLLEQLENGSISVNQVDGLIQEMEGEAAGEAESETMEEPADGVEYQSLEEMPEEEVVAEESEPEENDQVEELEEIPEAVNENFTEDASAEASEEDSETVYEDAVEEIEEISEEPEEISEEAEEVPEEAEEIFEETEEVPEEAEEIFEEAEEVPEEPEEISEEAEKILEATEENSEEEISVPQEVVRDVAKIRSLSREERDLFAPYIQSKEAREQLVKVLDHVSMASYTGNAIITGEEGVDVFGLAKNIVSEIKLTDNNFNGKMAKISGGALNTRDMEETLDNLDGGALIVNDASGMTRETAKKMYKHLQQEDFGIIVILLDSKKKMDEMLRQCSFLKESFTARMDVEVLSNDLLVTFGKQYAEEQEYFIDSLGELALHTCIENLQTNDHTVTTAEVKEMVDDAIRHVNRKTLGHFFDIVLAKRYDQNDMIILSEKDFIENRFRK